MPTILYNHECTSQATIQYIVYSREDQKFQEYIRSINKNPKIIFDALWFQTTDTPDGTIYFKTLEKTDEENYKQENKQYHSSIQKMCIKYNHFLKNIAEIVFKAPLIDDQDDDERFYPSCIINVSEIQRSNTFTNTFNIYIFRLKKDKVTSNKESTLNDQKLLEKHSKKTIV